LPSAVPAARRVHSAALWFVKRCTALAGDVLSIVLEERKPADLDAALAFADEEQEVAAHERRKPTGRKPLPEHLPRDA